MNTLSAEQLRRTFRYDDGKLFWRERPREDFDSAMAFGAWKAKCLGKEAGHLRILNKKTKPHPIWIIKVKGVHFCRSRVVWCMHCDEWIERIDHADLDSLNDRIENLRPCNRAQNRTNSLMNRNNKCGFKGVYFHKASGKYVSEIAFNKKGIRLGHFDTPEAAHAAYAEAAVKYYGEFARS